MSTRITKFLLFLLLGILTYNLMYWKKLLPTQVQVVLS